MSTGPKRAVTGDEVSFDLHQAISAPVSDEPPIEHAAAMLATTINVIQVTIRRRTAGASPGTVSDMMTARPRGEAAGARRRAYREQAQPYGGDRRP